MPEIPHSDVLLDSALNVFDIQQRLNDTDIIKSLIGLHHDNHLSQRLSQRLLETFGSLSEVLNAPVPLLLEIKGINHQTIATLRMLNAAIANVTARRIELKQPLTDWPQFIAHLRTSFAFNQQAATVAVYLNGRREIIRTEVQQKGTVDQVCLYPREIAKRALELNATGCLLGLVLPNSNLEPDHRLSDDIQNLHRVLATLGIELIECISLNATGEQPLFRSQGNGLRRWA